MAWIESHQQVGRHPKTKKMARLLGVSLPAAVGHIHYLWWWALDYAQDGDLSRFDAYDIKDATHWEGDEEVLIGAFVESGYVDVDDEGGLHLHDWFEYAGKLAERRAKDRARKAEAAEQKRKEKELQRNSSGKDEEGAGSPYVPNQTKPNQTKPTKPDQTKPEEGADAPQAVPYEKIRELFNSTCLSFSKVVGINGERKVLVAARWKEHPDLDWWAEYFEKVEASDFLKGKNDRKWKAKFDWLINAANMNKVLEGNYDGDGGENNGGTATDRRDPQQYTRGFKE